MRIIGIDLGTTNSVVYTYEKGVYTIVEIFGHRSTPSVVGWHPIKKNMIIGWEAKKRILISPETIVVSNKRYMGDKEKEYLILGNKYSPVDITSFLLKYLADGATESLGADVTKVVITVPAYFNQNQKEDTKKAAEKAGLEVLALQQEPTAAALAYGIDQGKSQTILVYDLGGGTFDVSILEVEGNVFTVKGIGGDPLLGGDNFDEAIQEWFFKEIKTSLNVDLKTLDSSEGKIARQKLKELAEQSKIELSSSNKTEGFLPNILGDKTFEFELDSKQYRQLILPYLIRTTDIVRQTLLDSNLSKEDINRVICVGGATKSPLVRALIEAEIKTPFMAPNVDEIVAKGAAITGFSLMAPIKDQTFDKEEQRPVKIINVTPFDLGIRTNNDKFSIIIPKHSPLPIAVEKIYSTYTDYAEETTIEIFQGEHALCSSNTPLSGFSFHGIQKAKAGVPRISVKFILNESDILEVSAIDISTNASKQLKIKKTEAKPFTPKPSKTTGNIKIGVSRIGCDNMGEVLDKMKFHWTLIQDKDFSVFKKIKDFDVLFINCCAGGSATSNQKALRKFVAQGGVLYVSDLSAPQISNAFPSFITFGHGGRSSQKVKAKILSHELVEALNKNEANIYFDMGGWIPISKVSNEVEIFLEAKVDCRDKGKKNRPIMAGFKYEKGYVIYTAFHNHRQPSKEEMNLLKIIALKPISIHTNTPLVELNEQNIRTK